ncbi:hypothetical protein D9756_004305 [Leucocoprinus leucothites]|uniref:FAD dependent oxidoreductase domain-containing protein n=1 Tax=Leucocoprinus leucothites TaxID=201217 RepID=A0A8H5G0Q9_9AGAR|nr:hypothetical protein D9756_004305 [Leucoagaricus leucothites]
MGSIVSHVRQQVRKALIRAVLRVLCLVSAPVRRLFQRLAISPGIPVDNPCDSYWMSPPSPIAKHGSGPGTVIPEYADVVIIGSGITGTSVARTLLDYDDKHRGENRPLHVVMLEARDACSGATGRNGGHITPVLYQDYAALKKAYGVDVAAEIIRFRLAHLTELLAVATEENLLDDSMCRETKSYDVYQDTNLYEHAKELLEVYQRDLPSEGADLEVVENREALKVSARVLSKSGHVGDVKLGIAIGAVGRGLPCIEWWRSPSVSIGDRHPSKIAMLLRIELFTHTPCTNILPPTSANSFYTICTPKGTLHARHVIHATNAWASHLLPGMRGKIIPARGVMTAQAARPGLGSSFGTFDYLTQLLPGGGGNGHYPTPAGEMMFGGGFMKHDAYLTEIGVADDSSWNSNVSNYLSKAMGDYFRVGSKDDDKDTVIANWGGIFAMSSDEKPWVGRVPESITQRRAMEFAEAKAGEYDEESMETLDYEEGNTTGEWVAAGYSGEGMVHAWLSGKALAMMVLGVENSIPGVFKITEERWRRSSIEKFVGGWM